jgi:hypothetical protein
LTPYAYTAWSAPPTSKRYPVGASDKHVRGRSDTRFTTPAGSTGPRNQRAVSFSFSFSFGEASSPNPSTLEGLDRLDRLALFRVTSIDTDSTIRFAFESFRRRRGRRRRRRRHRLASLPETDGAVGPEPVSRNGAFSLRDAECAKRLVHAREVRVVRFVRARRREARISRGVLERDDIGRAEVHRRFIDA